MRTPGARHPETAPSGRARAWRRRPWSVWFSLLALLTSAAAPAGPLGPPPTAAAEVGARALPPAGLYYRMGRRDEPERLTHPLIDAVILAFDWAEVEPERGRFAFSRLRDRVRPWAEHGKGVVLLLTLYGQEADDGRTPAWVYESGVEAVTFPGGGVARQRTVRVPKVWDSSFVRQRLEPLLAAYAREFDGDPAIWYVVLGFGHLGNVNAQPSRGGAVAFTAAGWTPDGWEHYCDSVHQAYRAHFVKTPLLTISTPALLKVPGKQRYVKEADRILERLGRAGVSVVTYNVVSDAEKMEEIHARLLPLYDPARSGRIRLGMGDDWPLWVPERRRSRKATAGYDDQNLARMLDLILGGGAASGPPPPLTLLLIGKPEAEASQPGVPGFRSEVHRLLAQARARLKENDAGLARR